MSIKLRVGSAVVAALAVLVGTAATTSRPISYRPPVSAPVLDPFRAPSGPYAAGNRGIDYDTTPGQPVVAIGVGTVTFVGKVAGVVYVTVSHRDGLRSSYSLATATVTVGRSVRAGQRIGTAADQLHLGVRRGSDYIDPASLFGPRRAILVPTASASTSPVPTTSASLSSGHPR